MQDAFADTILARLGLARTDEAATHRLVAAFWGFLGGSGAPFERTFFDWYGGLASMARAAASPSAVLYASEAFAPVRASFEAMTPVDAGRLAHPYFAGTDPCTLLIDEVEALRGPIAEADDWSALHAKLAAIDRMAEAYGTGVTPLAASSD